MTLNEYQESAMKTALPAAMNVTYMTLGLANEAGEVAGKLKKQMRDFTAHDEFRLAMAKELGDTLWYLAGCATQLGFSLETIAGANLTKLASRQARGVIGGSGDER